jgi:hypothetical protein
MPGPDAQYSHIRSAVNYMGKFCMLHDEYVVKTVRMGAGIGGLEWPKVREVLESVDYPVELQVYYL